MLSIFSVILSLLTATALPLLGMWRERVLLRAVNKRIEHSAVTVQGRGCVENSAPVHMAGPEVRVPSVRRSDRELLAKLSGYLPPPVSS